MLQAQANAAAPQGSEVAAVDYSEEKALMALYLAMSKQQVRRAAALFVPVGTMRVVAVVAVVRCCKQIWVQLWLRLWLPFFVLPQRLLLLLLPLPPLPFADAPMSPLVVAPR
jgi:hypothetical protein